MYSSKRHCDTSSGRSKRRPVSQQHAGKVDWLPSISSHANSQHDSLTSLVSVFQHAHALANLIRVLFARTVHMWGARRPRLTSSKPRLTEVLAKYAFTSTALECAGILKCSAGIPISSMGAFQCLSHIFSFYPLALELTLPRPNTSGKIPPTI